MGKNRKKEFDYIPLPLDYPAIPPPPPPGGWREPERVKIENIHDVPPQGTYPPLQDDPLDVRRFYLRVGKINFAMNHPLDPESLMLTYVDVGDPFPRAVVSEIGRFYKKQDLEGRKVVALCNIQPIENLKNVGNTAMLMCAKDTDAKGDIQYELWNPPPKGKVGEEFVCEDHPWGPQMVDCPTLPFMRNSENIYQEVIKDFGVNEKKEVVFKSTSRLFIKNKPDFVTTSTLANCSVKTGFV